MWMDTNNEIVYVNDIACHALGYAREELLGKPLQMISTPTATTDSMKETWRRLRGTGFLHR